MTTVSSTHVPEVSIGMPVYNGAEYLSEAIDSILSQTFTDFELIISDNASTDSTAEICAAYCRKDARVRYIRLPRNIGASPNWNYLVSEARGTFFKWASANDRCERDMLEKAVAVLRRNEDVALCYGRSLLMNDDGSPIGVDQRDLHVVDPTPADRMMHVWRKLALNNAQAGLIRLEKLRQTGLERPYPLGDIPLMAELALKGSFVLLEDVLHYRRMGRGHAMTALSPEELKAYWNPSKSGIILIRWRIYRDLLEISLFSTPSFRDRYRALAFCFIEAVRDRGQLGLELLELLRYAFRGLRVMSPQSTGH